MPPHASPTTSENADLTRSFLGVFRYSGRALELVWSTSRALTIALALLTLTAGLLPAGVAYIGAHIVDAVVSASRLWAANGQAPLRPVFEWVAMEGVLVAALAGAQRGLSLCQSLL
ncbi:MAG TPA: ABC transporter ATP-binding protein, partial [Rhodanobacter sp.]